MTDRLRTRVSARDRTGMGAAVRLLFLVSIAVAVPVWDLPAKAAEQAAPSLQTYGLADRSNLRRLENGDFLFRLARDTESGIVYWAYMGSTRHVIAVVPDRELPSDSEWARAAILRVADLPRRVGCGVGLIHRSWVYLVPGDARFLPRRGSPTIGPELAQGEVRNDVSGRSPVELLSFRGEMVGAQ